MPVSSPEPRFLSKPNPHHNSVGKVGRHELAMVRDHARELARTKVSEIVMLLALCNLQPTHASPPYIPLVVLYDLC